jgi:hypothetical protein
MKSPTISMADTARKKRMPILRSATPEPGRGGQGGEDEHARDEEDDGARL